MIELTDEQASVLKQGYPVRVSVPQLGGDVVVVLAAQRESTESVLQETLDEIRENAALSQLGRQPRFPGRRRIPTDETGRIYWVDLATGRRPGIIVSRESLNQGNYVVMVLCTTKRIAIRSRLPNCVLFQAGEFGIPSDCVAQCEAIYALEKGEIGIASGMIGRLDTGRLRDVIKAVGDVIDSDCEPN